MNSNATLYRLLQYVRPYKLQVLSATFFTTLNRFFDALPEALIGVSIDVVVNKNNSFLANFGFVSIESQLYFLGFVVFITWLLESITQYVAEFSWGRVAYILQHKLRADAYGQVQRLPISFFETRHSGEIVTILNDDVNHLEKFFEEGIMEVIKLIVGTAIVGAIFFYFSPIIAIWSLLPVPFIFIVMYYFQQKLGPLYQAEREAASEIGSRLVSNISGIRAIKSYVTEYFEQMHIDKRSQVFQNKNIDALRVSAAVIPIVRMTIVGGFIVALIIGGKQVIEGTLNVGAYSLLVFMTQRLLWPFTDVAKMLKQFEQDMACAKRVFMLIDTPEEECITEVKKEIPLVKGEITFEHVDFVYPNGYEVFDDFNLQIRAGQTIGFVGETGSGKSTVIKLLLRLYEVTGGVITIDGKAITDMSCANLRKQIGLVAQDSFLFSGTLAENISYGTFDATREQIIRAAEYAEIDEFIDELPEGYDSVIGERGATLSGGQRQRIALARAILKDAPIYIFDEATSALDNETEVEIQKSLEKISADHTTIVIAHRLSTVRNADVIYVIEDGKVLASGTHEELTISCKRYAKLCKAQFSQSRQTHEKDSEKVA